MPEVVDGGTYSELVAAIGSLHERAREKIATTANTTLVDTYWHTGRYIVEYEQHGADRAKYGSRLLSSLARDLTLAHGKGFNRNNLQYMRKLYRCFPICTTLSCKLSWSHYLEILKCSDELELGFYAAECARSNWNVRELRRQMKSLLFERRRKWQFATLELATFPHWQHLTCPTVDRCQIRTGTNRCAVKRVSRTVKWYNMGAYRREEP